MDDGTKTALEVSIRHWEKNACATNLNDADIGPNHCALCSRFNRIYEYQCRGCPVKGKTGKPFCEGTPYIKAHAAYRHDNFNSFHKAAIRELDFLRGLRK